MNDEIEIERLNNLCLSDGDSWTIRYNDYGRGFEYRCYIWSSGRMGSWARSESSLAEAAQKASDRFVKKKLEAI